MAARLAAATASRSPPDGSSVTLTNRHHHRSASDDLLPVDGGKQPSPTVRTAEDCSGTQPIGRSAAEVGTGGWPRNGARVPTVAVSRRDTMPPMHLLSATNEARAGLVQPQQLPLKLASTSDTRDSSRTTTNRSTAQHASPAGNASSQSHFNPTSYDRSPQLIIRHQPYRLLREAGVDLSQLAACCLHRPRCRCVPSRHVWTEIASSMVSWELPFRGSCRCAPASVKFSARST